MNAALSLFALLVGWHALADYPLQGDFLSMAKRPGRLASMPWLLALFTHAYIHAIGVLVITGNWVAAAIELVTHMVIDYLKCQGKFGIVMDQSLHVATKVAIVALRGGGLV